MKKLKSQTISGDEQLEAETKLFNFFDKNQDGFLDATEFGEAVFCAAVSWAEQSDFVFIDECSDFSQLFCELTKAAKQREDQEFDADEAIMVMEVKMMEIMRDQGFADGNGKVSKAELLRFITFDQS